MNNKKSLYKDYIFITAIILFTILALAFWFVWSIYHSKEKAREANLAREANQINNELIETFNYVNHIITVIANDIIESDHLDLNNIANILKKDLITSNIAREQFSWLMFDWDTPDNKMVVSTLYGVLKKPKDISNRNYAKMSPKEPWKLHFDKLDIGISSGELIIPAGVGITDYNNKFLGIISLGFSIDKLNNKINKSTTHKEVSYLVLDKEFDILLYSLDNFKNIEKIPKSLNPNIKKKLAKHQDGKLSENIYYNNVAYSYFYKMENFPFYILMGYNQSIINSNFNEILLPGVVGFLVVGIVSILLLVTLRYLLIRPVVELANIAEKVVLSSHIPENLTIPKPKSRELYILAKQLSKLIYYLRTLKLTQHNLANSKKDLEYAHHQMKLMNEQLESKVKDRTQELERALAAKTEFLNNISHEIRTPIQGVTAISNGLVEHWQDFDEKQKFDFALQVSQNANRLFSLINNLLDLSKFNAGKMLLEKTLGNIEHLLMEVIDESKALNLDKKLNIIFYKESRLYPPIIFDYNRIAQVVRNLLSNAIKFSTDGTIEIKLSMGFIEYEDNYKVESAIISIKDEGIGIPDSDIYKIFEPFTQSSRTKTKAGGTGLGLSICAEIIKLHHGKVWVINNNDKGSTFYFSLPIHHEPKIDLEHSQLSSPIRILIIDDEQTCLNSMKILLHGSNFIVNTASSGKDGINYLNQYYNEIDIILLDLMMHDIDGVQILEYMQNDTKFNNIPVILQSGIQDEQEINKAYLLGAKGYISKPYNKEKIYSAIYMILYKN